METIELSGKVKIDRSSIVRDKVVAAWVGQRLVTVTFLLAHSFPSRWKVAESTLQLSPVRVVERQPRAPPFQLVLIL